MCSSHLDMRLEIFRVDRPRSLSRINILAELKIVIDQCLVSCLYKDQVSHLGGLNRP